MPATTTRLALPYPLGTDANNVPADMQKLANAIDGVATVFVQNTFANRPAAAVQGRIFAATDTSNVYYDTGTAWIQLNINSAAAAIQAKGDLLVGTGAGAFTRLPAGSDGQMLSPLATASTGMQWAANPLGLPLGLTGVTSPTRYVGATASGKPTTGTYAIGDFVIAQDGPVWVCTAAGTPGTWVASHQPAVGASLGLSGATAATRYVGGTTSGRPTTGTFATGDYVVAQNGITWVCTAAGTPGTWAPTYQPAVGAPLGLTGATATTRFVGATTSGAPTSGTWQVGDLAVDQRGGVFLYTGATNGWARAVGRTLGPYIPSSFNTNALGAGPMNAATITVPDPGFPWYPLCFGSLETQSQSGTRAGAVIYNSGDPTNLANVYARGSGLDPAITGGTPHWQTSVTPYRITPATKIPAGASTSALTFSLAVIADYGSGQVSNTTFLATMEVWIMPA